MKRPVTLAAVGVALLTVLACASPGGTGRTSRASSQSSPLYALTLMRQGSGLLQQRRFTEALEHFREARDLQPENATIYNMIGLCHLNLGEHEQALEAFNQALLRVPAYTDSRNNRGSTYLAMGEFQLAEVDFNAVLADTTYPHRWEVHYNLGVTFLQRNMLALAAENFRKAATAPSPVYEAFLRLAEIAEQRDRTEVAVDWLQDARLKFPERLQAPLQLGRILVKSGRESEAVPYLREVINADPDSEAAAQAHALLAEL
mgnify:CR=1 FL=1